MEASWNNLKNAITAAFTPERISAFADAVAGLADKLGPVADRIGQIADGMGSAIRYLSGNTRAHTDDPVADYWALQSGDPVQVQMAKDHIASANARNAAVDSIDEASDPQVKIQRALAFKYSKRTDAGRGGEYLAGADAIDALSRPGAFRDPVDIQKELNRKMDQVISALKAKTSVVVKVGANDIAHAAKNAPSIRTTPGQR